jgi:hypothetical protein
MAQLINSRSHVLTAKQRENGLVPASKQKDTRRRRIAAQASWQLPRPPRSLEYINTSTSCAIFLFQITSSCLRISCERLLGSRNRGHSHLHRRPIVSPVEFAGFKIASNLSCRISFCLPYFSISAQASYLHTLWILPHQGWIDSSLHRNWWLLACSCRICG